jgi:hypothetical protein
MVFSEGLIGKRERISVVNETAYGTGGTMSSGYVPGLNVVLNPNWNKNWMEIISAGEDNRYVGERYLGPTALPFTLDFIVTDFRFLRWLGYSSVDTGSDPYTHTLAISNVIQSFKLEWAWRHTTPVVISLVGCFAMNGTLSFTKASGEGNEGFIKVSLNCYANSYSIGSSVTSVGSNDLVPFQWRHTKVTLDNVEKTRLNNGDITIDNGINPEEFRYCNTTIDRGIGEPVPLLHRISGRYNLTSFDDTEVDLWDSEDVISNCDLDFIQSASNKIETSFTDFRIVNGIGSTELEGIKKADIVWNAKSFSSIVVTDSISTY